MNGQAQFEIVRSTDVELVIRDVGPWDKYLTITNDAEGVVARVAQVLAGRRLFYIDSYGDRDELLVRDGKFAGFAPARGTW
jgi:hypothetical protein